MAIQMDAARETERRVKDIVRVEASDNKQRSAVCALVRAHIAVPPAPPIHPGALKSFFRTPYQDEFLWVGQTSLADVVETVQIAILLWRFSDRARPLCSWVGLLLWRLRNCALVAPPLSRCPVPAKLMPLVRASKQVERERQQHRCGSNHNKCLTRRNSCT